MLNVLSYFRWRMIFIKIKLYFVISFGFWYVFFWQSVSKQHYFSTFLKILFFQVLQLIQNNQKDFLSHYSNVCQPFTVYSSSCNLTPPISRVLICRHLIFCPSTWPTCCNSPRKCARVKYKARQKAGFPIATYTTTLFAYYFLFNSSCFPKSIRFVYCLCFLLSISSYLHNVWVQSWVHF